ncbi:hypothetical protein EYF80_001542 [Liparis tanakae]|uniref:Uncharacterized protein n=1 Tax=Liparis tanakae TaxID=230148 RepID=A0A4Z2JDK8_9TELE|nr:hypothetical protein EYF80_001542 [Liparis tanakae]
MLTLALAGVLTMQTQTRAAPGGSAIGRSACPLPLSGPKPAEPCVWAVRPIRGSHKKRPNRPQA